MLRHPKTYLHPPTVGYFRFINLDIFGERAQMANEVEVGTPITKVVHVTKTDNAYEFSVNPGLFFH